MGVHTKDSQRNIEQHYWQLYKLKAKIYGQDNVLMHSASLFWSHYLPSLSFGLKNQIDHRYTANLIRSIFISMLRKRCLLYDCSFLWWRQGSFNLKNRRFWLGSSNNKTFEANRHQWVMKREQPDIIWQQTVVMALQQVRETTLPGKMESVIPKRDKRHLKNKIRLIKLKIKLFI